MWGVANFSGTLSLGETTLECNAIQLDGESPFGPNVFDDLGGLRILTADDPREGLAPPPHKFVVHTPGAASGHPSRGGLLRATALAFLGKQYALKDWLIYAEVFGMPVRIARYDPRAVFTGLGERRLPFRWNNVAGTIGVGYDIRLAEYLWLRPILNVSAGYAASDVSLFGSFIRYRTDLDLSFLTRQHVNVWGLGGSLMLALRALLMAIE